jgi:hypothetical protein
MVSGYSMAVPAQTLTNASKQTIVMTTPNARTHLDHTRANVTPVTATQMGMVLSVPILKSVSMKIMLMAVSLWDPFVPILQEATHVNVLRATLEMDILMALAALPLPVTSRMSAS